MTDKEKLEQEFERRLQDVPSMSVATEEDIEARKRELEAEEERDNS
jgi:hypothetical protein